MRLAAAGLVLALAVLPAAVLAAPLLETTISTVLRDRGRLDGRTVRVRGVIDQCDRFVCRICPEAVSEDGACITVRNWESRFNPEGSQYDAWKRDQLKQNERYRFSVVLLEGRVNFLSRAKRDKALSEQADAEAAAADEGLAIDFFPCTNKMNRVCVPWEEVVLERAQVTRVTWRMGPLRGRSSDHYATKLSRAPAEVTEALRAQLVAKDPKAADRMLVAFLNPQMPQTDAFVCVARKSKPPAAWPTTWGGLYGGPSDGYRCYSAFYASYDKRWGIGEVLE